MANEVVEATVNRGWLYHPTFPEHWTPRALHSMARWVNGIAFKDIQFTATGRPVIKIAEIKGGISGQTKFTQQTFDDSVRVQPGDLLFSWSGQPETSIDAFWWRGPEGWLNQHVFRVTPEDGIDIVFFYYLLRYLKPNFIGIARNKQTTGLGHVTKRDLENLEVAYPQVHEQRAIARILGTLDDKIELNRQMSATLEAMARALYKSWFVDFEPVRAKAEGGGSRLPPRLAALFPDRFSATERGFIPEGWNWLKLDQLATPLSGGTPRKSDETLWGGGLPWVTPKSMGGLHVRETPETVATAAVGRGTRLAPKGAIFVMVRGMGLHQGLRISQARREMTFNQDVKALVPTQASSSFLLFGLLSREHELHARVKPSGHGTGVLESEVLLGTQLARPPAENAEVLAAPFDAMNERIAACECESQVIAALRDTLLPRLISGELRVKDAETFLDRVL